jgi:hypothetical protein
MPHGPRDLCAAEKYTSEADYHGSGLLQKVSWLIAPMGKTWART